MSTIAEYLESGDHPFSTMVSIIKLAGLYYTLDQTGPLTFFAADNLAFEAMGAIAYSKLINEGRNNLRRLVEYHILPGYYKAADLIHSERIQTLNGNEVMIFNKHNLIKVNDSIVTRSDIRVSNGIIHVINKVL